MSFMDVKKDETRNCESHLDVVVVMLFCLLTFLCFVGNR